MTSNLALEPELESRHYVLHSPKHPRRWAGFAPSRIQHYKSLFGNDFCLVVTGDPERHADFYAIPWTAVAALFVDENRLPMSNKKTGRVSFRWQIHLDGPEHHFQLELSPGDTRERPRFDATPWYGNAAVLDRPLPATQAKATEAPSPYTAEEGAIREALHSRRERDPELAREAKRVRLAATGRLTCEVCGFDFSRVYGTHGAGYIEAHHTIPLRDLLETTTVSVEDLALVCANCHRMLHRGAEWLSVAGLRDVVRDAG